MNRSAPKVENIRVENEKGKGRDEKSSQQLKDGPIRVVIKLHGHSVESSTLGPFLSYNYSVLEGY